MASKLNALPQEYFARKIADPQRVTPSLLFGMFFGFLFSLLFVATNYLDGEPTLPVIIPRMIFLIPLAVYFLLCIAFLFTKKNQLFYLFLSTFAMQLFLMDFWLIISQFALVVHATRGGNSLKPELSYIVLAVSLFVLLGIVAIYIYSFLRVRKRIIQGHYRKDGLGYWDNHLLKSMLLGILAVIGPPCMALPMFVRRHELSITWDSPLVPVFTAVLVVLILILAYAFAYGTAIHIMKMYYIKRFGNVKTLE